MKVNTRTYFINRWFEVPSMSVDFEIWLNSWPTITVFEHSMQKFKEAWLSGSLNPTEYFNQHFRTKGV